MFRQRQTHRTLTRLPRWNLSFILLLSVTFSSSSIISQKAQAGTPRGLRQQTQPSAPPEQAQETTVLAPSKPIERDLLGGQKHDYQITLAEGQYASVIVEQRGIDLVARWLGPDGKQIAEFDSESRPQGIEETELVAEATGRYRLSIEAAQKEAPAGSYAVSLVELRAATGSDRSLQEARRLCAESIRLWRAGKYDEALPLGERALAIREKMLGPERPSVAAALNNLGNLYKDKGDLATAEQLYQRALKIREKVLGPEHPDVAQSLNNLAVIHRSQGDLDKAELLYQRALEIKEKALGPEHPSVATSLNNLAIVCRDRGDYVRAEPLYQRALKIREKILGPEHPDVAQSLNNLAIIYFNRGDIVQAESLYQRALRIREKALGPEHPDVAASLNNLAIVYRNKGDFAKAEQLYQRALKVWEAVLGPEHSNVAAALINLANFYNQTGDFAKAEPLCRRALNISEKALGPGHPRVATALSSLADVYHLKGDYTRAEPLYQRALEISEKARGPEHWFNSEMLNSLASLYAAKGDAERAVTAQARANLITEHNIALNLTAGSERQKLAYLASLSDSADRTLSLHLRTAPDNPLARDLAATIILQRKGRVQDAMADSLTALRQRFTAQDQRLLDQLKETTAQLARLVLNGPQGMTLAEHQNRVKALEDQSEKLESEISRRSAGFYQRTEPVTLAAVQSAIPADAAVIEFSVYRPFDPKAAGESRRAFGEPRYVAYVIRRQGEVKWQELGAAEPIDAAIDALRRALCDPKRGDMRQLARAVDEKVMERLRPFLGDATRLLISPDGALNLIPFEALVDQENRYLVERYAVTYLTSGRDLIRLQVARQSLNRPLVIADPLFGEPAAAGIARATIMKTAPVARIAKRQSVTGGDDLSSVYFAPLSGTAQEAQAIKSLFPEASILLGQQATESALKVAGAPRLVHIATHGFFLTGDTSAAAGTAGQTTRAISTQAQIDNPLLRSGLALAGANLHTQHREPRHDDGILTAMEASGLNLWGTRLVVLSACDTGLGEVRAGEGVYGLRRAFVLAGAETLVMSLWGVSDAVTREMMVGYYAGLKRGLGRGEALRQVQLRMLKRAGREHPFYWGSFIQTGEWAALDGRR
jgi:CHAT domain-containing protein/Tfp pilus assembly protein PilF